MFEKENMSIISKVFVFIFFIGGLGLLASSFAYPGQYYLVDASAIQATHIYAVAQHQALIGIGLLLAGILVSLSGRSA